jgi:hypothetical protein
VLGEEAQVTLYLLAEETPRVARGADVHCLRAGEEQHLPAGGDEAVTPIHFLAEDEEVLVGQADRIDRFASRQQAGSHQEVGFAHAVVLESAGIEGIQQPRPRRQLAQEEVLRRQAPGRRKAAHGPLHGAVRIP